MFTIQFTSDGLCRTVKPSVGMSESVPPTSSSRSASLSTLTVSSVWPYPASPALTGESAGMRSAARQSETTGIPFFSAKPVTCLAACAVQRGPPSSSAGFSAFSSAALRSSSSSVLTAPSVTGIGWITGASVSSVMTSSGRPTTTGPGRPERAAKNASATYSDARSASSRTITRLAWVPNHWCGSNSWKASFSRCSNGINPVNSTRGVESCHARWMPTNALDAPGPRVTMATPGSPVSLPCASAM